MLKQIIILLNLLSFIIITALLPADIKIETKLPDESTFIIDSTYIIEVAITKGAIFGFAKFQQDVPPGFIAQPVETADASFTFADGKVKFIWMAIPETDKVVVKYALTASDVAAEIGMIEGKFSYIEDNERRSYDIPNIPIKVISDEPIVAKVPAVANVERAVKELGANEYEVTLVIKKAGIEGFAKLEEYLPEGAEAKVLTNSRAVFSQVDDKAKFVWMAIPDGENVTVTYQVKSKSDIAKSLEAMEGNFSFLDENETKTVAVQGGAPIETLPLATTEPAVTATPTETKVEPKEIVVADETKEIAMVEPKPETPKVEDKPAPKVEPKPVVKDPVVAKDKGEKMMASTAEPKPSVIPNPETGVSYKVQVAAGKKLVSEEFLRKTYAFKEPYLIENHEGWVKYTTGQFAEYKGARDKRENLNQGGHNFPGPFVTAYNAGERITVQEALMISNQKWFK